MDCFQTDWRRFGNARSGRFEDSWIVRFRQSVISQSPNLPVLLLNPPTAQYNVPVIKHNRLPWRDGRDRSAEFHRRAIVVERAHGAGSRLMAMPDLCCHANRAVGRRACDPVHLRSSQARPLELGATSNNDGLFSRTQLQDIQRLGSGDAEALPLTHCKAVNAAVPAQDVARLADDGAAGFQVAGLTLDERCVIAVGAETDMPAVGLVDDPQAKTSI